MLTIRLTAPFLGFAIAAPMLLQSAPALADNAACGHAYESAQVQKSSGTQREAKKNLLVCAQSDCPAFIEKSCTQWLSDVNTALP